MSNNDADGDVAQETEDSRTDSGTTRRGLLGLGTGLLAAGALNTLTGRASATDGVGEQNLTAAQNAMYVRDSYVGADAEKMGLGGRGWLYFTTDEQGIYYNDGSSWNSLGVGGTSPWSDSDGDGLYSTDSSGVDVGTAKASTVDATTTETTTRRTDPKTITDTTTDAGTNGHSLIYADTSSGPVTVTLSSADVSADGTEVEIYDVGENAGTNPITVETESSETINPGSKSSLTVSLDGGFVELRSRNGSWWTDRNRQSETVQAEEISRPLAGKDDTTESLLTFSASNDSDFEDAVQKTSSVGTSSKTVASLNRIGQALVLVDGEDTTDDGRFYDLVHHTSVNPPTVLSKAGTNSPEGRNYSRTGNKLELRMDGGDYLIRTRTLTLTQELV
jgi:hypothetical protein